MIDKIFLNHLKKTAEKFMSMIAKLNEILEMISNIKLKKKKIT